MSDFLRLAGEDNHDKLSPMITASDNVGEEDGDTIHLTQLVNQDPSTDKLIEQNTEQSLSQRYPWFWECLCWILSLILYLTILIILTAFSDKKIAKLPKEFQLNAIIGLLSSIANSLLLTSAASVIGQSKWLYLHRRNRNLEDLQLIDRASRGPGGSLVLLFSRRTSFFGLVAALIVCLALFLSTFVQLSLKTYVAYPSFSTNVTIPYAQNFTASSTLYELLSSGPPPLSFTVNPETATAVYNAFYATERETFPVQASCPTNNCAWSDYYSLAIINECTDLTPQLAQQTAIVTTDWEVNGTSTTYTLSNGFTLLGSNNSVETATLLNITASNVIGSSEFADSIAYSNTSSVLVSFLVIGPSGGGLSLDESFAVNTKIFSLQNPVAYECVLRLGVQQLTATQVNSTLTEQVTATFFSDQVSFSTSNDDPAYFNLRPNGSQQNFTAYWPSTDVFNWLSVVLNGVFGCYLDNEPPESLNVIASTDFVNTVYQTMNTHRTGFPDLMDNLASSLTRSLRMAPYQPSAGAPGTAFYPETRYEIAYGWLGFPLALLGMILVALLGTMLQSTHENQPAWKNDSVVPIFLGMEADPERERSSDRPRPLSLADMRNAAKEMKVSLQRDDIGGQRVVLTDSTSLFH